MTKRTNLYAGDLAQARVLIGDRWLPYPAISARIRATGEPFGAAVAALAAKDSPKGDID